MSAPIDERLYQLVPAIYRLRDAAQGEPLRALLDIIQAVYNDLEADIGELYDNWFIETCDEWVVPYIGDLLGVRGLYAVSPTTFSQRARVANTIGYRRRKGTAAILEQLARDVTGWPAHAVEFFRLLETTQYINHIRLSNVRTPDLRDTNALELLGGPFERAAHTADVRHIDIRRGKYNIANIGLFLWRLQSYPVTKGTALRDVSGGFHFNPLGKNLSPAGYDEPLFNQPQPGTLQLTEEAYVPGILRLRALYDELEARRRAIVKQMAPNPVYFGDTPVFQVYLGGSNTPVPPEQILICDLSTWKAPPAQVTYTAPNGTQKSLPIAVSVDPKLGRLMPTSSSSVSSALVSYSYGFSGDVGGGPYNRQDSATQALTVPATWQRSVGQDITPTIGKTYNTIGDALNDWNGLTQPTVGIITIMDSRTYKEDLTIKIQPGSQLLIVAAEWPDDALGQFNADGPRPHLLGNITVTGTAPERAANYDGLALNGLLIEGAVTVQPGNLGGLRLAHCTVVPGASATALLINAVNADGQRNDRLAVTIDRAITGPIVLPGGSGGLADAAPTLAISDSIVTTARMSADYTVAAITASLTAATLQAVTVLGTTAVRSLDATNCIFAGAVTAARRQIGCVRFCFVTQDSKVPRRYRCQPDLALSTTSDPAEQARILAYLQPLFVSLRYGDPTYAQLDLAGPAEIATGADDQGEMGAFHFLTQPQRVANLTASLDEYLRFGLEAGIFFVT